MAFNGSGVFNRLYSWVTDAANGVKISSTRMDAEMDGMATGLSTCITKDGQTTPTADIPLGGFKIKNLGSATLRTDAPTASQVQLGTLHVVGSVAGTNTITGTLTPTLTAYSANMSFELTPVNTITASATINLDGVGALTLKKSIGGALVALVQNDLIVGVPARITLFDATTPVLMNPQTYSHGADIASAGTVNLDTATGDCVDVTGTTPITAITLAEGRCCTVRFTGALTLTNGSSLVLPNARSILTIAGDYAVFRGYAAGVVRCVAYSAIASAWTTGGPTTNPANTGENTLATITLLAGTMGINGRVRVTTFWTTTGGAGSKTPRIKFGGTVVNGGTAIFAAGTDGGILQVDVINKGATNAQSNLAVNATTGSGFTSVAPSNLTIDTTANVTILITGQQANAGDVMTLNYYKVETLP